MIVSCLDFVVYATLCVVLCGRRAVYGRGSGQTPLHWAAESNHASVVALLSDAAPLLSGLVDERDCSPRDIAIREGAASAEAELVLSENLPLVAIEVCWNVTLCVLNDVTLFFEARFR